MAQLIETGFPRGTAPIHAYGDLDHQTAPVVLLFMDAFGPRPTLDRIAERLAGEGYRVLMPDLFYEHRPYVPLEPQSIFSGGEDRQRLAKMLGTLDQSRIDADVGALLRFCEERFGAATPIAATGYCLGGRYALTAVSLGNQVVFGAAFHGSHLAPEAGDGPLRQLAGKRARVYVGVAGVDPSFGAAEEGRLAKTLREAGIDHVIETYAGAAHGFVMDDLPVANAPAAERHWQRLSTHLCEMFAGDGGKFAAAGAETKE